MVIGAVILLVITNLKLTLIILASVPVIFIPILLFGKRVRTLSRESQDTIADVGTYAGEVIQQIKTVQSYTQEEQEKKAFGKEVDTAFKVAKKRIAQRAFLIAAVILMVFGGLCAMLWTGGNDVISGNMSPGDLGAFVFYAMLVASGMGTLSEAYSQILQAVGATDRLMGLMHADNEILPPEVIEVSAQELSPDIQISEVTFRYPSRPDIPALDRFSLNIEEGKTLALVGPSGAGKSTVFELLQRFYDPQVGAIKLDGTDIRKLSPQDLRHQIAVVAQHPALFTADVSHNIRYGNSDASDEEVTAAAQAAYADEFILQLPNGYQSFLGEQGVRLSGGQKQRIAIARAILKNPRILLLDEATSALDTESEFQVQKALEELMADRTTVIIAHRLSTVLHADSIAVMDEGRLVAQGTHHELIASNALYARLAELQFKTGS
jgi:ATP-binding cassette subfamily B protein